MSSKQFCSIPAPHLRVECLGEVPIRSTVFSHVPYLHIFSGYIQHTSIQKFVSDLHSGSLSALSQGFSSHTSSFGTLHCARSPVVTSTLLLFPSICDPLCRVFASMPVIGRQIHPPVFSRHRLTMWTAQFIRSGGFGCHFSVKSAG